MNSQLVDMILSSATLRRGTFEKKRILISGGAGFLGSWLCEALLFLGAKVDCIDNLSTGQLENIATMKSDEHFRFMKMDVCNPIDLHNRYDYVVHFASRPSPEEYQKHPIKTLLANSSGSVNMLEIARRNHAIFLYASSSEVYGDSRVVPTPEEYWGYVNPIGPRSSYDEGKRFGEAVCMGYHREHGLDTRILRIFNTYGPRIRSDGAYARAIPRFIMQAISGSSLTVYGSGSQTRSFCFVSDTIGGALSALSSKGARGEVVNIGGVGEISVLELATKIIAKVGRPVGVRHRPLPIDDPKRRCPDISKAKTLIRWAPKVDLDEGLKLTIEWFKEKK